jgi:hypothetical protein
MHSNASADLSGFFRNSYSRVSVPFGLSADRLNAGDVVREEVKKQMSSIMLLRPQRDGVAAQKASDVHERPHFPPAVSAALGWTGAALGVYALEFGARGPLAGVTRPAIALAKIAVILIAGAIYARRAGGLPAGFVPATGIAWLAFSIAADIITGIGSARAYQLLGNPSVISAILRDATIVAWLGAPTLFARNGIPVERGDDFARYR